MRLVRVLASIAVRALLVAAIFALLIIAALLIGSSEPPPAALAALHFLNGTQTIRVL